MDATQDRIITLLDAFEVAWSGPRALVFGVVLDENGH